MDWKDYLMDELWPLLTDEQKARLVEIAAMLAQFAPPTNDDGEDDSDD